MYILQCVPKKGDRILDQKAIPVHPTIGARCEWVKVIEDDI